MTKKHPPKYLNEFEYHWNTRYKSDGERVAAEIKSAEGKRLTCERHVWGLAANE